MELKFFQSLDYFSTECIYSPNAYRGYARAYIKDLEQIRPSAILDIIHSGEVTQYSALLIHSHIYLLGEIKLYNIHLVVGGNLWSIL